jgi:hypothetical protein
MPLLVVSCSSNSLLSLQGVQQPCEDPLLDSSLFQNSKEFFHVLSAPTQCPPGRASRILSDSNFSLNPQWIPSSMQPMHLFNALLVELYRTPQRFYLLLCLSSAWSCLQGVQQP